MIDNIIKDLKKKFKDEGLTFKFIVNIKGKELEFNLGDYDDDIHGNQMAEIEASKLVSELVKHQIDAEIKKYLGEK
jgi:hypothetical protein